MSDASLSTLASKPAGQPVALSVMLTAKSSAALHEVSLSTWWRLDSAGLTPRPVRFAGNTRWRRADLAEWSRLGCPDRATFDALTAK